MRPITFENLRRLMGGGRKKKDRAESSFKRSDSFKRISIKRNYLERGGNKPRVPPPQAPPPPPRSPSPPAQWLEERPPTPPPRRRGSSIATDSSSLEIIRLEHSPVTARRRPGERDSAISVNLGRVWLDAPLAMAPRSLELPRPPAQGGPLQSTEPPGVRRAHHSLDSALKDKQREDCGRRFLEPRCSSKDSGFSFSISIPRLADVSPASVSPPPSSGAGGFFRRRKKLSKPAPSVSRDGYFKRTSGAGGTAPAAPAEAGTLRRSSSRKKKSRGSGRGSIRGSTRGSVRGSGRRKKLTPQDTAGAAGVTGSAGATGSVTGSVRSELLYQVVVSRPPRSLSSLKLDPMIFVAPEKRKTGGASGGRAPHRYEVQEIRGPFLSRSPLDTEDEGLYEEVDSVGSLIGGSVESLDAEDQEDPDPEQPLDLSVQRVRVIQCPPGNVPADSTVVSPVAALPAPMRPSVTIKTKQNHVTRVMINMPSDHSSSDADTEDESYVPQGFSPVPRRRPVQRRKSARKNVKYLAKPCIHRAPSTLRRARKSEYGSRGPAPGLRPLRLVAVPRDTDSEGEWI